jgi:TonB family protein
MGAAPVAGRVSEATVRAPAPPPTVSARVPASAPTVKERTLEDTLKPPRPPAAPVGVVTRTPPPKRALPIGLVLGVAGVLFVVAASFAGYALLRGSEPEPTPPPAPPPTVAPIVQATPQPPPTTVPAPVVSPGALRVSSVPSGAAVSLNGEPRGETPLDLSALDVGIHEVKVELKGYAAQTRSVTLTTEQPSQDVAFNLSRPQPTTGTLEVVSTPSLAAVSIDGVRVGETPLAGHRVKIGTHRLEVSREGHRTWSEEIAVEPGRRRRVDAQLEPLPAATPPPTPRPDVVDPTRIYLQNEVDTPPRKVKGSVPYPPSAPKLRSGESASVVVSFVVTEDGEVSEPRIVESGGKVLDEAVLNGVRDWKYQPGVKLGVKVKVRINLRQTFQAG